MKEIICTQGKIALVDDDDYEKLARYKWCINSSGYAHRISGKQWLKMHRVIMNAKSGEIVDHINHNRLDNRKENLRITTKRINCMNRKRSALGTSYYKTYGKWRAKTWIDGKSKHIGYYDTKEEAQQAYLDFISKL